MVWSRRRGIVQDTNELVSCLCTVGVQDDKCGWIWRRFSDSAAAPRLTRYSAQRCGVTLVSLPAAESMVYKFWWCQLPRHTKNPSLLPVARPGIARDRMPCDKRRSPNQRNSRLTCRSVCCRTQRHNGQPAMRPDVHKRPYRNRQYPPYRGVVYPVDRS